MKTIKIKDYYGVYQEVPVSDELYEEWRALQRETRRVNFREQYHRDGTPMEFLEEQPQHYTENEIEDQYIRDEEVAALYEAIQKLSPIQQRRVRMFMDDLSIREIARREGCRMDAARKSVGIALNKLHTLLKE